MNAVSIVLAAPVVAAAVLAAVPGYRISARLNMAACLISLLAALSLFARRPARRGCRWWSKFPWPFPS